MALRNPEPERDVYAEMRALMQRALDRAGSGYVIAVVAQRFFDSISRKDRGLLLDYLYLRGPVLIAEEMGSMDRSDRAVRSSQAARGAFADAVKDFEESGNPESLSVYYATFVIDNEGRHKRALEMTDEDFRFVASDYRRDAKGLLLEARFAEAIAKKIGARPMGEVFSREQYEAMYGSFVRKGA